jgi:hypothetical protein
MIKRWLIALFIAGLSGGKAFADCVPSPDRLGHRIFSKIQ